ncbi:hypothetical protein [Arthrobacter methylotrophus]|uniref:hypothetical protein n=1 Tax=Arthrobacter methylotrophus TaxID=121291 RepID=UPI0031E7BD99
MTVQIKDAASRDQQLEQATSHMRERAATAECGILVTRINHATFEISLSAGVGYGLTEEADLL